MNKNPAIPDGIPAALAQYLNCPCQYFAPMCDDDPLMDAFHAAQKRGKTEGFIPVLIAANDATLLECLATAADAASDGETADADAVEQYRNTMLSLPLGDGKALLQTMIEQRQQDAQEYGESLPLGSADHCAASTEEANRFLGYWDYNTEKTMPLLLAEIPVAEPWQVFAYLPFGGWNDCPDTPSLMEVAQYWYRTWKAAPAVMTSDVLEFSLPCPVPSEAADALAMEQYAWCPDIVDQGVETIAALAAGLPHTTCWYFWWD